MLNDLVEKSGAWYSYGGERIGQGKENARQYFKDNPAAAKQLDEALRAKLLDGARKGGVAATEDAEEVEA